MAQVAHDAQLEARIDAYLNYLRRKWEAIPDLAAEWADWDRESRFTFAVDWGVPRDRLTELGRWADEGLLTPSQEARYHSLLKVVEEHRSTLERLLQS